MNNSLNTRQRVKKKLEKNQKNENCENYTGWGYALALTSSHLLYPTVSHIQTSSKFTCQLITHDRAFITLYRNIISFVPLKKRAPVSLNTFGCILMSMVFLNTAHGMFKWPLQNPSNVLLTL